MNTTIFLAGDNRNDGDIVRWDNIIVPAPPNNRFTIRSEATSDSDSGKAYPINGFMLQAMGTLGNQPPNVNAGADQQVTLPIRTVIMNATVTDDGLGDSLTRKVLGNYGNDLANWQAATPTPGY